MANDVKMPQLSDTMHSGKILTWNKKVGDVVKRTEILAEVETDKANLEIESFQNGTLLEIRIPAGQTANVGDVICVIGEAGEKATASSTPSTSTQAQPVQATIQPLKETKTETPKKTAQSDSNSGNRIIASPLAKKIASQNNIDLSTVSGSGPNGRITKSDLEGGAQSSSSAKTQQTVPTASSHSSERSVSSSTKAPIGSGQIVPFTKMRETIARRMVESVTQNPHFFVTNSIIMDNVVELRELLKLQDEYKGVSVNHFVIKAAAYALSKVPAVNCVYRDNGVFHHESINVGIITSIPDGLLIPVIKDTHTLSLRDVVFEAKAAVERAKAGRPSASDLSGGTFSISNMGMFDVENFTAIINPGQGGILAVSAIKNTPIVKNGVVVPAKVMKVTLSVDHRIIDGIAGANFLKYFKESLEHPALLMT